VPTSPSAWPHASGPCDAAWSELSAGMNQAELRAKIRALMTSGGLPRVLPAAEKIVPGQGPRVTRIVVGQPPQERCLACEDPGPQVSYAYTAGKVVRLHAACEALWQQERGS